MSSAAVTINKVSCWLNYLLALPMIILGIIGAILTIIIFTSHRSFYRNPTIIYLLAGAIMTAIHLLTSYLQSILIDGFGLGVFNTNDIACREYNYLLYVTTVPTISFPCWASFNQYASTCREVSFRNRWSSMRVARFAIIGSIVFWAIVYIPIIVLSQISNGVCLLIVSPITKIYDFLVTPLVYTIGPLTLIIIFTWSTMRNLRSTALSYRHDRLAKQIRRMLLPQLIVLAISGIPYGLQNIYFDLTSSVPKDDLRKAVENVFVQIIRLFYHCNFVCAFYIYFYMSREVRRVLKRVIRKTFGKNVIIPVDTLADNFYTLQTLKSMNHT